MALIDDLKAFIGDVSSRRLVIVGIGSPIRRDDAVGLRVLDALEGKNLRNVLLLKTEIVPESYTGVIRDFAPTHVLMIDAAHFKGKPGEGRIIPIQSIADTTVSTHNLPLTIFADFIKESMCSKVALLGIQVIDIGMGEGLTQGVTRGAKKIAEILTEILL